MRIKHWLRIILAVSAVVVLAMAMVPMTGCQTTQLYKIGISQLVTHPALDAAREGIIEGLAEKGYVEGEDVEFDYQNSELDMSLTVSIAEKFVSDKVDLIVTIATPNTQAAISAVEGTDIPVVFSAITDPVGSGMVASWESHPNEN
ncbi:MAG: sugar ABC transporter substrate-binding protein, partial [Dehalococcoidia bacterium]